MREKKFTPNDNGSVIRMLSAKYARCNRGRNRILLGAVALSIVTLTIIFGISYGRYGQNTSGQPGKQGQRRRE